MSGVKPYLSSGKENAVKLAVQATTLAPSTQFEQTRSEIEA